MDKIAFARKLNSLHDEENKLLFSAIEEGDELLKENSLGAMRVIHAISLMLIHEQHPQEGGESE